MGPLAVMGGAACPGAARPKPAQQRQYIHRVLKSPLEETSGRGPLAEHPDNNHPTLAFGCGLRGERCLSSSFSPTIQGVEDLSLQTKVVLRIGWGWRSGNAGGLFKWRLADVAAGRRVIC